MDYFCRNVANGLRSNEGGGSERGKREGEGGIFQALETV